MSFTSTFVIAVFMTRQPTASGCTKSTLGACEVLECVDRGTSGVTTQQSAGVITVAGVRLDAGFVLTLGDAGCLQNCPEYQPPPGLLPVLWNGGETLTASATGETVGGSTPNDAYRSRLPRISLAVTATTESSS